MPLLHRFTSAAGDDMLVIKDDRGWTFVVREMINCSDTEHPTPCGNRVVRSYTEISYTDDQVIEFAEKILELTREQG